MPNLAERTIQHVIYIPTALMVGMVAGYVMGARAVRAELERRRRRMKE
jgi:hypothetical protein